MGDIHISLLDLINVLLYLLGTSIGVLLLISLIQLFKTLQNISSIVSSNKEKLNTALSDVPSIVQNTKQISTDVKYTVEKLKISLPSIFEDAQDVSSSVKNGTESISNAVDSISSNLSETAATAMGSITSYISIIRTLYQIIKTISQQKSSK